MMTVGQLREMLKGVPASNEVRLLFQPSYPLQYEVEGIYVDPDMETGDNDIVYLVQGSAPEDDPYGDPHAWDMIERPW